MFSPRKLLVAPSATLVFAIAASGLAVPAASAATTGNVIQDSALQACINTAINDRANRLKTDYGNRATNAPVTQKNLEDGLFGGYLDCSDKGVSSLKGLEYAKKMTTLRVTNQQNSSYTLNQRVSDISPLTQLPNLQVLDLRRNNISALPNQSAMSKMTGLTNLNLEGNGSKTSEYKAPNSEKHNGIKGLSDISSLTGLPNLQILNVNYNDVTSLKGVEGLRTMQTLMASHNSIRSLEPLRTLNAITDLRVDNNYITDISAVTNLSKMTHFELGNNNSNNQLNEINQTADGTSLDISALANKPLTYLNLFNNNVASIEALRSVSTLRQVDIHNNKIADLTPLNSSKAVVSSDTKIVTDLKSENSTLKELSTSHQNPDKGAVVRYDKNGRTYFDLSKLKTISGQPVTVIQVDELYRTGARAFMTVAL